MLAEILPGFREVRAPLVAGYLWLLFAWLVAGDDVSSSDGTVGRLFELGGVISDTALAAAATFVAYLIGSLSEDLFVKLITVFTFERYDRDRPESELPTDVPNALVLDQMKRLENEEGRLRAERNLRVSIVTPLAAILIYLIIFDSLWWLIAALVVLPALLTQAFLRTMDLFRVSEALHEIRVRTGVPPTSGRESSTPRSSG